MLLGQCCDVSTCDCCTIEVSVESEIKQHPIFSEARNTISLIGACSLSWFARRGYRLLFLGPKLSSRVRLRLCLHLQFLISRRCRVPFSSDLHFTSSYRLQTTSLETALRSLVRASRDIIERPIPPLSQRSHDRWLIARKSIIATQDRSSPCRPNATSSVPQSHPHALFKTPRFWHD